MISAQIHEAQWSQFSALIAQRMGLHYPSERWDDLHRGLTGAAQELGFENPAACIDSLLSVPPSKMQLQVLASHLTIGETYFFRDKQALEALSQSVLPSLIRAQRSREQRLRVWSAACCSGEEAYTLAILLHEALPDLQNWQVSITATDINARFLHKAAAGTYGEWSFRNVPIWIKERYFKRTADGRFTIVPEIKRLVTFAHLNLVEDSYPSLTNDNNAMDLILCRNVLMYFSASQMRKVIANLHHTLIEGGWLLVSPSEASQTLFPQFRAVNFPGAILYQKSNGCPPSDHLMATTPLTPTAYVVEPLNDLAAPWLSLPESTATLNAPPSPMARARELYQRGDYAEAANTLVHSFDQSPSRSQEFSLLVHALANQGKLSEALAWCNQWISIEKMDPASHYLHAVVLLEQGNLEAARASLLRVIYLQPEFVLAHFALGNLARRRGKSGDASKHFANTAHLLQSYQPGDLLPESDGLTAGRLLQTLAVLIDVESSP